MNNVLAIARQAETAGAVYAAFLPLVEVELAPLPEGVTVVLADPRACGCRLDGCYFCDALDFAVWEQARIEEEQEIRERYWHVYDPSMYDED